MEQAETPAQGPWEGLRELCWVGGYVEEGVWTDGWTDGRTDGWMDGVTQRLGTRPNKGPRQRK